MNGLADTRIETPTPLQQLVVPVALQGKHLLVKTEAADEGAFLIPILQTLTTNGEVSGTRVLILTPSIERARIIDERIWALGYHAQISSASVSMKGDKKEQENAVLDGAPVIVANPGRLVDILEKTRVGFKNLTTIVIDEAHNMENFNLVSRVKSILELVENTPQVMVFSTSMNKATQELAKTALVNPEYIGFDESEIDASVPKEKEPSAPPVDEKTAQERLKKISVKVVLNPEKNQEKTTEEAAVEAELVEETTSETELNEEASNNSEVLEETTVEAEAKSEENNAEATLEVAEVAEVETPDQTDETEEVSNIEETKEDSVSPEEKLKKASVKVVLNPKKAEESAVKGESEEAETKVEEDAPEEQATPEANEASEQKDAVKPKEKLKAASIKVVLKQDRVEVEDNSADKDSDNAKPDPITGDLTQGYINVPPRMKISTLMAHLEKSPTDKVVVFAASKRTTDRLFRIILKKNWGVVSVHEGIDQATFDERFEKFTSGEMKVLLVGGIPAKDINIDEVKQVINYDVPGDVDEYRYRAELVGNGKAARIVSLVSKMDKEDIDRIVKEAGYAPVEITLPDEIKEKKQRKKPAAKKSDEEKSTKPNKRTAKGPRDSKRGRGGNNATRNDRNKANPKAKTRSPKKEYELPRPSYDGLSGGRDGKDSGKSGGMFGWVKKLFN